MVISLWQGHGIKNEYISTIMYDSMVSNSTFNIPEYLIFISDMHRLQKKTHNSQDIVTCKFVFIQDRLYNSWLWNRLLSVFINLRKCNIHRAAGEVNIRFWRLISQIATYSKVNDCFISWKCFIFIYLQIHHHTNKMSQFWGVCLSFSRKTSVNRNLIGYWTTKERIW